MISKTFLSVAVLVEICVAQGGYQWQVGQKVKTTSGIVTGHSATLAGNSEVSEYLGVPYVQPPVGKLRWMPPVHLNSTKEINATKFGPTCPPGTGNSQNEDCLTLNIWTKPQTGEKKKAVLVSIHGGGFNTGSSQMPSLHGAPLANRQDVVVVSMNYRLSIFGFPGAPGLKDQNLGMLDIRASVEWVRDNIAAFGGDPSRITIFGESAGGGAVDIYSFAFRDEPIVAGLIAQSGSSWTKGIAAKDNDKVWYSTSTKLGCGSVEAGAKTTECLKGKSWQNILQHLRNGPRTPGETFGPVFDEKVFFEDYDRRAKEGAFIKVPLLTGTTHNEAGFFKTIKNISATDNEILNLCFTCVAQKAADARLDHKVPIWRYRFFADFPNNRVLPGAGAFHGSELPFVYGTPKFRQRGPTASSSDTPEAVELTELMMKTWAAFAKNPKDGLTKMQYPQYLKDKQTLIRFGFKNNPKVSYTSGAEYDNECPKYWLGEDAIHTILERSPPNNALKLAGAVLTPPRQR